MPGWRDEAKERVKEKSQGSSIKIVEGQNCVRVLPDKKDIRPNGYLNPKGCVHRPYREFRVHYDIGPDKVKLGCGHDIDGGGKCWLCDVKIPELESSESSAKRGLAQKIRAKEQFVVNASVFDPDTKKFSAAKAWWISTGSGIPGRQGESLAVRIFARISAGKKDYVDPVKGYNINITRTGTMLKTRYPEIESDENSSSVPAQILVSMKSLDSVLPVYDEEEQKSAYFGRPKRDDNTEKEEVTEEAEETTEEVEEEAETESEETETEAEEEAVEEESSEEEEVEENSEEETEEFEAEPEPEIEEEEEEPAPPPKKKTVAPPAKKPVPAPAPAKKLVKKK